MSDATWPLWRFTAEKPAHWDDYVSEVLVFADRVEITTGWKDPQKLNLPAAEITYIQRGMLTTAGMVSIETRDGSLYEFMASWDKTTRIEFVKAVKSILPPDEPPPPPAEED